MAKSYDESTISSLQDRLNRIVSEVEKTGASLGVMVKSLDREGDQAVLFAHDADKLFTPASNTKILTVLTALQRLGGDFRYQTEISYTGELHHDGVLSGDLVIKGFGDPTLHTGAPFQVHDGVSIAQIVAVIAESNIRELQGNIIVDTSYFDEQRLGDGWAWDYESEYYSAQTSPLSLNRGTVLVEARPGAQVGDAVEIALLPNTSYIEIQSDARTSSAEETNTLEIKRKRGTNSIIVKGNLPLGEEVSHPVTVNEPPFYVGTVLKEALAEAGLLLTPECKVVGGAEPADKKHMAVLESAPLKEFAKHLNKTSDNHYAEMLLKTMGAIVKGEGSATAGIQVVRETLEALGVKGPFELRDGSGLSPYNLVSPRQILTVLEAMTTQAEYENLLHSFPISGVDGTLESRLKDGPLFQQVKAKTGTLTSVSGLSGYVTMPSGERLVFSIMGNRYPGETDYLKAQEDRILLALADSFAT